MIKSHNTAEVTARGRMMVKRSILLVIDVVAVTLMTDREVERESMIVRQNTQTAVGVGVPRHQGVAENLRGIAVGPGSVGEVEVVHVTDAAAAAENVEADLPRDVNPVVVHRQTCGSNRSRYLAEWTCP